MTFIAIDLGTSFIKGAVLDLDAVGDATGITAAIRHIHREPFPAALPGLPPLYREIAPEAVLAAVRALLARLIPAAEEDGARLNGIVMCTQMHGLVLTTATGEPRSNLTTWQDQRVLEPHPSGRGTYFDVLASRLTRDQIRQLGNELRPGLPVTLLFMLAEQGRLPSHDLHLATLPDFVIANLSGTPPSIEVSNAMAHGALNLETLAWHDDVIAALGLQGLRWPAIRAHGEVVGALPLGGRMVPFYTPIGDYQCAILGSLLRYGELSLNISTGSQVSLLRPGPEFGDFQTRPFFDGRYLSTITHVPAGRALTALVRLLSELAEAQGVTLTDPWGYVGQAAAAAGPTRMRANLAFFNSSCGDRGSFTDVREEEMTVGHIFRAAFQNMTDNYHACALRISPERAWENLVFSGGLAQKFPVLRELICERFAAPYRMCPSSEDTLLGLLALALAFTGRAATVEQAAAHLFDVYREAE
jgi:sugar (pentulose or hexulose) kinase